ncbi:MAG: hypothetical protein WC666_04450 [Candidatus Paceibacterota bacterium]|jgi:hypothetical protein
MHKTKIKYLLTVCAGGLIGLMSFMRIAHAETHITRSYINNGEYWSAEGSPYIIDTTVSIDSGKTLTVGPGVSIIGSSLIEGYDAFYVQGSLILKGEKDKRITISGSGGINVSWGTTTITYADISLPYGLGVNRSNVSISNSTISGAYDGLWISSSKVNIQNSRIDKNDVGIYVQPSGGGIFQVNNKNGDENYEEFGIGGIGNALDDNAVDESTILAVGTVMSSEIKITNSSISDNTLMAIQNGDTKSVNAVNNWWGTEAGPSTIGVNKIRGLVEYAPWLSEDPFNIKPSCCSSILFIPGLEASRLYRNEYWPKLGTTTNTLWEPNRNADVEKLFLDSNGSSTDKTIYSGGPIDSALGFVNIYESFIDYLDNLSKSKTINEWKAFGYDWRKPITEVVAGAEIRQLAGAVTTESLVQTVIDLAGRSKTGKVTLIAHSNGGLVAKYLVKTLVDMKKESLIDSVISVAVPYLGTPQAIAGLLHGDKQSMLGGLILKDSTARSLGVNMASTYSLLPSREFFSKMFSPTIVFASTSMNGINNGSYSKEISSFEEQNRFITNSNSGRLNASSSDVSLPIKGNQYLTTAADIVHSILDPFSWPASIARFAIAGWNSPTMKGLVYDSGIFCHGLLVTICDNAKHHATTTLMGDGTVVVPSAVYNAGEVAFVDLKTLSNQEDKNIDHANILEASSTRSAVDVIVTHNPAEDNQVVIDKLKQIPGVTIGDLDYSKEPGFLVLSTHSPVELHVYDSKGNHTGIIPKPASLSLDVEDGLYTFTEEKIIGSKFESVGGTEEDPEYQIYLPDNNEKYSVVLNGTGVGEFTFNVDRIVNGSYVDKIEYARLPVTPLTIAETTVLVQKVDATTTIPFASTSPVLNIDIDGNGKADIKVTPNIQFDPIVYLESIKTTISTLAGNSQKGLNLIKRIDKIEYLIKKGKIKQLEKVVNKLDKKVSNKKLKGLNDQSREQILNMIDSFITQYE